MFLPPLEPGDRTLRYDLKPLATYIGSLKDMARTPLLMVMLAWGYFYFLAGVALLIIPEYTVVLEHVQRITGGSERIAGRDGRGDRSGKRPGRAASPAMPSDRG